MSSAEILRVFAFWQTRLDHPKALLTKERRNLIDARLKEGYSVEDLEAAIEGCGKSSYHMGKNENGTVFDDLTLICRTGSKVEQFIGYLNGKPNGTSNQTYQDKREQRAIEDHNTFDGFRKNAAARRNGKLSGSSGSDS